VKVDCSCISGIPADPNDIEITAAIIAMAHKLHVTVTAEGVETPQQLVFLRQNRCDFAQGYLFCQPMTWELLPYLLPDTMEILGDSSLQGVHSS
jgi:EAL domain-containing protein (putative c-di-GMP-specific phosphodiesterase class I)